MTARIIADAFQPIKNNVFVSDLDHGMRVTGRGIILPDDNMTERGIKARWAQVYAVGPEVDDLQPGEWVYVEHGRWTHGIDLELPSGTTRIWRVEYPKAVLMAASSDPRNTSAYGM